MDFKIFYCDLRDTMVLVLKFQFNLFSICFQFVFNLFSIYFQSHKPRVSKSSGLWSNAARYKGSLDDILQDDVSIEEKKR